MTESKEVAVKKDAGLPAENYDWGDYSGRGFEDTTSADLIVPFINVLQALSPQVEENKPEGSRAGMLYNTVTDELAEGDKGMIVIPVKREFAYVEWVPRKMGGGFVGLHAPDSDVVKEAKELARKEGPEFKEGLNVGDNDLIETYYLYLLILDEAGEAVRGFAVLSCSSTKIARFKKLWTGLVTQKGKPPVWSHRAVIKTTKEVGAEGPYFNIDFTPFGGDSWPASRFHPEQQPELLPAILEFEEMLQNGLARADFANERAAGAEPAGGKPSEGGGGKSPF